MSTNLQATSQYSLAQILGIWAAAAIPMALLGWVANPILAPYVDVPVGIKGITFIVLAVFNTFVNGCRSSFIQGRVCSSAS